MVKGGFKELQLSVKKKKYEEILFTDYAIDLIKDTILANLPDISEEGDITKPINGGGNFIDDFNSWIKIIADPYHDFKPKKHEFDTTALKEPFLIRSYQNILDRSASSLENAVLIKILQDVNPIQGISLKYCRFYKKVDNRYDETLWKNLEQNFDAIDKDSIFKFYILNATIQGTGSAEFKQLYRKIVPLSAYWDPFKASNINFKIIGNSNFFYDSIYYEISKELYAATGIRFTINETDNTKSINLVITAPNQAQSSFIINRQGFSIKEINIAISELSNDETISLKILSYIIEFLKENGADNLSIISFLLVCKMSGDIGCVYFIKNIDKSTHTVKYDKDTEPIELNVKNKPIIFLYTTDKLCGALAIANNVKCVVQSSPLNEEVYLCQYVGSKGILDKTVLDPYYDIIYDIVQKDDPTYDLNNVENDLPKIYIKQFNKIFMNKEYKLDEISSIFIIRSPDDLIRYVIAIVSLKDFKEKLKNTLNYIIKKHLKKQKHNVFLLSLSHIKSLYNTLHSDKFFDPLLQYFIDILIIPNEDIKKYIYDYISKEIKKNIGISLTDNYRVVSVLYNPILESSEYQDKEDRDTGMPDLSHVASSSRKKPSKV